MDGTKKTEACQDSMLNFWGCKVTVSKLMQMLLVSLDGLPANQS